MNTERRRKLVFMKGEQLQSKKEWLFNPHAKKPQKYCMSNEIEIKKLEEF